MLRAANWHSRLSWVIATLLAISQFKFPSSPPFCPAWLGSGALTSHRLFQCLRCHSRVRICTSCDRGQRFCPSPCAAQARRESTRRANKKYRESSKGRRRNRLRQRRYRKAQSITKQIASVTHQGSTNSPSQRQQNTVTRTEEAQEGLKEKTDAINETQDRKKTASKEAPEGDSGYPCDFCHRLCGHFARRRFLPPPKRSQQRGRNWNWY